MSEHHDAQNESGNPYRPRKLQVRDPLHDLQLLRDLQIINERTQRELAPLLAGGLPVEPKRKPKPRRVDAPDNSNVEDEDMKLSHTVALAALAALAVSSTLAACNPVDTSQERSAMAPQEYTDFDYPPAGTPSRSGVVPAHIPTLPGGQVHIDTSKPIPFDRHNFGVECFDTYGCKVRYADIWAASESDDELRPSSASYGDRYPDLMSAGISGIRNFPLPAEVVWRDKEGNPHKATVDIAAIFRNQTVLHQVPQEQLPPILTAPIFPRIVLEVNNRTVNVWMRGRVPTKELQIPGNKHSRFRDDMILACSKTY